MLQIMCSDYTVFTFSIKKQYISRAHYNRIIIKTEFLHSLKILYRMSSPDVSVRSYFPACPDSCVECVSVGQCRVCAGNMFVKNGQCTPDCGHGYYADRKTKKCQGNTTLEFNYHIEE